MAVWAKAGSIRSGRKQTMTRSRLLALGGSLLFSAVEARSAYARHAPRWRQHLPVTYIEAGVGRCG